MILMILAALAVVGLATFLTGYVWNGFTARKQRLGHKQAVEVGRKGAWRFKGRAVGFSWSDEISFAELKRAVRNGGWRRSMRVQQFLLVTVGGLLGLFSMTLLIGWITRPIGVPVAIGLVLYALIQLGRGFHRAA